MRIRTAFLTSVLVLSAALLIANPTKETPKAPTVLRIGSTNVVKTANVFGDYELGLYIRLSNPTLMKMNSEGKLTGALAESWETKEGGRVWRFTIAKDYAWSDGKPLTGEDVRFSMEYTSKKNPNARWIAEALESSRAEGNTVTFVFKKPYTRLDLEFTSYPIFPKHVWEGIADPMAYANAGANVGAGPYYLASVNIDEGILSFERNPYWRGKMPAIDRVEVHTFKSMDVLSLALANCQIDMYWKYASTYPYQNIEALKKTGRFDFAEKPNLGLVFLGFNMKKEPMADKAFREALSLALDYAELVRLETLGYGDIPTAGFVPPSMEGYVKRDPLKQDSAKAAALLDSAGYRDGNGNGIREDRSGKDFNLTLLIRAEYGRLAELVKEYLGKVGVSVTIKSVDQSAWVAMKDSYDYDMTITRTTPWGMLMHANWGTGYFDSRRTGQGVLHSVDDPEFLGLCDEILAETRTERLAPLAARVQEYYARVFPGIALAWNRVVTPISTRFRGWENDPLFGVYNIETLVGMEAVQP